MRTQRNSLLRYLCPAGLALCLMHGVALAQEGVAVAQEHDAGKAEKPLRGIILFIGDGMGVATVTAARIHKGSLDGRDRPASASLALDGAPRASLVRTYSEDMLVTDSAAAMTAMMTGHKARNGVLCCKPSADGGLDTLTTLLEMAKERGLATGIVSTTRITHATPAGLYAHCPDRDLEQEIAEAILPGSGNPRLGDGIDVILGGGSKHFLPSGTHGEGARTDGRDLIKEMQAAGYRIARTAEDLRAAVREHRRKVFGIFSRSHMDYEVDRVRTRSTEPSLVEMTSAAIGILRKHPNGFFLMVEGGRIDHALHETNGYRAVTEMLHFDQAVAEALTLNLDETLILATSDHDHTMVVAGYPPADRGIFAEAGTDEDGLPYTAILFATGPAEHPKPEKLTERMLGDPDFQERSGVPTGSEVHGGMDVPLYAWGPERFLRLLPASLDNTEVYSVLRLAVESAGPDGRVDAGR